MMGWRWLSIPVLVGVILLFRDRLPDPAQVWKMITEVRLGWLVVAVVAEGMSMGVFARLLRRIINAGGAHLTLPRAVAVTYARNAVSNSLPAGPVLSVAYALREFRRFGATTQLVAGTLVLTGVFSTATFLGLGVVALLAEPSTRVVGGAAVLAMIALVGVQRLASHAVRPGSRTGRLVARLREALAAVALTRRDTVVLILLALLNWVLDVACLAAVFAAADVSIGPNTILLGYVAAKAAGVLALLPGGLGVSEIGMAAVFITAGVTGDAAAAVVAIYRLISFWAVLAAGWLAWLVLQLTETGGRRERRPSR
jgi:uncharacterized membrane protein YbhN (UPF0104 family)